MLSKEEWNANKDSTSIIYCFEDGTTKKWETRTVQLPEQDEMIRNSWDNRYAKKMLEEHKEAFDQARYEKIMEDVKKEDLL